MNYFLRIAYDGTDYRGLQRQPGGVRTVQGEVEAVLREVHHRPELTFNGCGRTDAGVHASQFYGHFEVADALPENYRYILNRRLPAGIVVHEVLPVHAKAHARYDATERTYDYFWSTAPDAFNRRFQSWLPDAGLLRADQLPEDQSGTAPNADRLAALRECLAALRGTHDYRAFCISPDKHNTTLCTFTAADFYVSDDGRYRLRFAANRFLRGMIRILVHDLLAVLAGSASSHDFLALLNGGLRPQAVRQAPPEGLFLTGVAYPYFNREPELPAVHAVTWQVETLRVER